MFKAFIFDFDGVIADTEPVHMDAWLGVLEPLGISFDEDEYRKNYLGLNDRDFLDTLGRIHRHHFLDADKANLIEQKSVITMEMLWHSIPLMPGAADFIKQVSDNHLLSICSGANRGEIEFILKRLKLSSLFNPIIAADSVKHGKPDPEGYIRALEGLQNRAGELLSAESVIAVEDSPKGIAAAKMAGLRCVAVASSFEREELKRADWVVPSLAEADIEDFVINVEKLPSPRCQRYSW